MQKKAVQETIKYVQYDVRQSVTTANCLYYKNELFNLSAHTIQ